MRLPLRLHLKPSRRYLLFLTSGHILAGVAVCLLPATFLVKLPALLILALLGFRLWRSVSRDLPMLLLRADGKFELLREGAEPVVATVASDTLVWPWLIVLHAASDEGRVSPLVLFRDGLMQPDDHRQLRLWLNWRSQD